MTSDQAVKTDTSGAASPPQDKPPAAAAVVPPDRKDRICPITGADCVDNPAFPLQCEEPEVKVGEYRVSVGRTFCALWIRQQREAGIGRNDT